MNKDKKWLLRIFCGFLAVIAAGTVISRAAASMLVAQVQVEKPGRGRLTYAYDGNGTVTPVFKNQVFLWPEQQVEWIAEPGTRVKTGECLVKFRMEYLQQAIEKKQAELTQMELQAEQQQISAKEPARVPAVLGAGQTLAEAQEELARAQQRAAEAETAYNSFLNSPASGGSTISGDKSGESNGNETSGAEENSTWLSEKQELEAELQEAHAGVESARQAVNQAQNAYELARQEDAVQNTNAANASEAALLGAEASRVQVDYARKELERLKAYQAAEGKICADQDCTVLQTGVQAGAFTTGSEVFVTGSGGFQLKGMVKEKDKEKLKTGAKADIQIGAGKKQTVKIESIESETAAENKRDSAYTDTSSQAQAFWTASLPENEEVQGGEEFTWNIETASETEYEQTIPLSALREDTDGAYCLVLSEEKSMLGTVQAAKRVPVTVLKKDAKSAAITSTLTNMDRVITSSEKYVAEGDRVRLKE